MGRMDALVENDRSLKECAAMASVLARDASHAAHRARNAVNTRNMMSYGEIEAALHRVAVGASPGYSQELAVRAVYLAEITASLRLPSGAEGCEEGGGGSTAESYVRLSRFSTRLSAMTSEMSSVMSSSRNVSRKVAALARNLAELAPLNEDALSAMRHTTQLASKVAAETYKNSCQKAADMHYSEVIAPARTATSLESVDYILGVANGMSEREAASNDLCFEAASAAMASAVYANCAAQETSLDAATLPLHHEARAAPAKASEEALEAYKQASFAYDRAVSKADFLATNGPTESKGLRWVAVGGFRR